MDLSGLKSRRPVPERPVIIQSGELILEGLYIDKKADQLPALLNSPHPKLGGSMDVPYLNETAYALSRLKVASLRYNYRGVGASQGEYSGGDGEAKDMAAATEFLLETYYGENESGVLTCAGYSFGAWIAYRRALQDRRIKRLLLVAPVFNQYDFTQLPEIKAKVGLLLAGRDHLCTPEVIREYLLKLQKKVPDWHAPEIHEIGEATHYFVQGLSQAGDMSAGFLTKGRFVNPFLSQQGENE